MSGRGKKAVSKSRPAVIWSSIEDFIFSAGYMHKLLRKGNYAEQVDTSAAVYLASILEYLCAEILDVAGNVSQAQKRQTILSRHLLLAVKNDEELNKLLAKVPVSEGGVLPNNHAHLHKNTKMSDDGAATEEELNHLLAGVAISDSSALPNTQARLLSKDNRATDK